MMTLFYTYIHVAVHLNKFLFDNQPDTLINQIYSVIKLHVSGIFFARHQESSTVHSALVSFMQFYDNCFQAESEYHPDSVWKRSS
jgi:hypothetical protein